MPDTVLVVDAILFDMDGTLIDSSAGLKGAWYKFKESYPHIDVEHIFATAHGVRTIDNLRRYCGIEDPELLEKESVRFDAAIIASATEPGGQGIIRLPGVEEVMKELEPRRSFPKPLWAICTSGTHIYAVRSLEAAGIPVPEVLVGADNVKHGKPHPEPYLIGAEKCGVDTKNCLVFEDAPNGIRSGKEAGCKTIALLTSHTREQVEAAAPDFVIEDLSQVSIRCLEEGVEITIRSDSARPKEG